MEQVSDALGRGWVERRMALGAAIRRARHPLTQTEVAKAVRRPQSCISVWERGGVELGVDRIFELEDLFGLRHGVLFEAGGYCEARSGAWWSAPMVQTRERPSLEPVPGAGDFPQLAADWLGEFGPLVEAAAMLRDVPREADALASLLASGPLSHLLLGWDLWEARVREAGSEPDELLAFWFNAEAIERCRHALWGQPARRPLRLVAE